MTTVLTAAKEETATLVEETKSEPEKISYQPQAFTREGRSD
jgi:hypothetical protein